MQEIHLGMGRGVEDVGEGGFLGEVSVDEFITGDALAVTVGLTDGVSQLSNEPWLKFLDPVDGKTKYIAKKPYRHSVSWDQIQACGAVFGTTIVTIQGDTYKVRLLKGAASDPTADAAGFDAVTSRGSEWNRLFYPLIPNPTNKPASGISKEGIVYGGWANYTEGDLLLHYSAGAGAYNWCQETRSSNVSQRVIYGNNGVAHLNFTARSTVGSHFGWRPVLELIP